MRLLLAVLLMCWTGAGSQLQDRLQAGSAALGKGDLPVARANLEEATRLDPKSASAWLLLARTYAGQKDQAAALDAARKAEALANGNPEILQGLANLYAGPIPDPAKAATFGALYAERQPQDATAWQRLAAFCLETGQPDRAIEAATRGLKAGNANPAALHDLLGRAYTERKQWERAGAEFAEAVKLNPYDEDLHFRRAQLYLLRQDWATAVNVLENARRYFDKSPQIELALGVARYGQRDFPDAIDQFLKTIRIAPDVPQPYIFLSRILENAGDRLPEIAQRFAELQSRHPKQPLGYILHAKALIAQMPPAVAPEAARPVLDLLDQALTLEEANSEAHYLAGIVLEREGEYGKAADHLERAVALDKSNAAAHYHLARVYARLGRRQDSERERLLHEKLSNGVDASDARGILTPPAKAPAGK